MFSLGKVTLWEENASSGDKTPIDDVAELFVAKVLGTIILKLKYEGVVYAVSRCAGDVTFNALTLEGKRYFYFDGFYALKKNIEAKKD